MACTAGVNKVLVINREITPGRITVVFVDEGPRVLAQAQGAANHEHTDAGASGTRKESARTSYAKARPGQRCAECSPG